VFIHADPPRSHERSGEAGQRRRHGTAQQRLARLPLGARVQRGQELYLAAREDRNREDVTIEHAVARERCEPRPGASECDEIERVGT
jgi:hypothetical protein